jgi:hypothetical protein
MDYSDKLNQLLTGLRKLHGRPPEVQVTNLKRLADSLDKIVDNTPAPFKVFFKKAFNEVKSLHDGLASSDAGPEDLSHTITAIRSLWDDCKLTEHKKAKDLPKDLNDEEVIETLDLMHSNDMKKEGQKMLNKYAAFKRTLPEKLLGKRFNVSRGPVIPITKHMLFQEKLEKLRVSTGAFEGYPVLDNQVLIGLDMDWLAGEYKRQIEPAVQFITDHIEERTNKRYHRLGGSVRRGHVQWVWMVLDKDLAKLNAATMGGHFLCKSWTFPFSNAEKAK